MVAFGAPARPGEQKLLISDSSRTTACVFQKGQAISKLTGVEGSERELKAGVAADLYVTVPKGSRDRLQAKLFSRSRSLLRLPRGGVATLRVSLEASR